MRVLVGLFVVVIALTGCSNEQPTDEPQRTAPSSTPQLSRDDAFVKVVTERSPQLAVIPDAKLVGIGEDMCGALEQVAPVDEQEFVIAVESFSEGTDGILTRGESAYFIGAASAAYCPEISEQLTDLTGSQV
jgi:hypothetical protein